jgi:hypothetical protein
MKKKILIQVISLLFLIFTNGAFADELNEGISNTEAEGEAQAISDDSEPVEKDPGLIVENLINKYLNQVVREKIKNKILTEGGWHGYAIAEVSVGPENPEWAKHRVIAYENALSNIENQFISTQNQTIV